MTPWPTVKLTIEVPGPPQGKGRPRVVTRGGRSHAYTPARTAAYERAIAWQAKVAMAGRKPLSGPLKVTVTAYFEPPKSWPQAQRMEAVAQGWATNRLDADNIGKAACDSLNGIIWEDDAQVAHLVIHKLWAFTDTMGGLRIEVEPLPVVAGASNADAPDLVPNEVDI